MTFQQQCLAEHPSHSLTLGSLESNRVSSTVSSSMSITDAGLTVAPSFGSTSMSTLTSDSANGSPLPTPTLSTNNIIEKPEEQRTVQVFVSGASFSIPAPTFAKLSALPWQHQGDGDKITSNVLTLATCPKLFEVILNYLFFDSFPNVSALTVSDVEELEPMAILLELDSLAHYLLTHQHKARSPRSRFWQEQELKKQQRRRPSDNLDSNNDDNDKTSSIRRLRLLLRPRHHQRHRLAQNLDHHHIHHPKSNMKTPKTTCYENSNHHHIKNNSKNTNKCFLTTRTHWVARKKQEQQQKQQPQHRHQSKKQKVLTTTVTMMMDHHMDSDGCDDCEYYEDECFGGSEMV